MMRGSYMESGFELIDHSDEFRPEVVTKRLRDQLESELSSLKPRERRVIELLHGIGCRRHSYEEVGKILGMRKQYVIQLDSSRLTGWMHDLIVKLRRIKGLTA